MARSAFVEVNITNSTKLAQDSQNTADNAVKGVTDLNDPNLMSVIEKQNNIGQFAGLTSQYNVLVQNAKDDGIDTTAVTTAYNSLNKFMADILADPDHASDIDRVVYKKYQDAYNEELAKLQNALQNNTNNKFTSAENATSQAASTANQAFSAANSASSQAQVIGSQADSAIAVQSQATVKAQSTADGAFSQAQLIGSQAGSQIASQASAVSEVSKTASEASSRANSALDKADSANAEIIRLEGGSTATIAKLEDGLGTKVDNGDFSTYKTQTSSQFAETVKEADFKTYQTQTSKLIEAKVDNGTYQSDKTQTAKDISSKVSSSDFNTYKTQTADLINDKVSNSEYASNKEQTASQIADRVSNSAFSTYQEQTASQIASKVDNGDFTTYKTQTADLISSKVATKDFTSYQATTAKSIESKVESSDFNTYKTQTASLINDKVSSAKYTSDKTQTDNAILSKVSKKDANNVNLIPYSAMPKANNLRWFETGGGGTLSVTTHSFYHNSADPLYVLSTARSNEVFAISPRFKINANTTYTFQLKGFASSNVSSMDVFVFGRKNGETQDYTVVNQIIAGAKLSNSGLDYRTVTFTTGAIDEAYIRVDNNGSADGKTSTLLFTELKLEPGDTATPYVYGAEDTMIAQTADDILLRVTKDDLIDQINIQAGNTLISSSGQLTLSGKNIYFDTNNPVMIPSANIDTVLVGKKLTAADISANTFTTNNGTFTVKQDGSITAKNMTLTGGTLTTPTINSSTINSSTINGTTLHGGGIISHSNNTSGFYPFTIESTGKASTTLFNSMDALRTEMSGGGITTKYRAANSTDTEYEAYDGMFTGNLISLNSGFTNGKDMSFSQSVSGNQLTGQVIISPLDGLTLHGDTQRIYFNGLSTDTTPKGIAFTPYGNINATGTQATWYVGHDSSSLTAVFGIDGAGNNKINFSRDTYIGNLLLGAGHTIAMVDGRSLSFKKDSQTGAMLEIHAGDIHYTSLVKSSLLSVKRDVQKADTAYWAQLVNSIDLATYQYKSDDNTSHLRLSSIVDDVNVTKQWKLPDVFISRDENGKLNGVDDSVLLNATLATVQEQQKEIDQLNGHNMELEARLNKLEAKLNG